MTRIYRAFSLALVASVLAGGAAYAQEHHEDEHYVRHDEWKKGAHIKQEDWQRGRQIDYRQYHLHAPPRGYEWRSVDGNYVLAAIATGVIASAVVASTAH